jgi:hypothetical protein
VEHIHHEKWLVLSVLIKHEKGLALSVLIKHEKGFALIVLIQHENGIETSGFIQHEKWLETEGAHDQILMHCRVVDVLGTCCSYLGTTHRPWMHWL